MPTDPKTPATALRPPTTTSRIRGASLATARKRDSSMAELPEPPSSTFKKPFPFPTPRSGLGPSASLNSLPGPTSSLGSGGFGQRDSLTTPRPSSALSSSIPSSISRTISSSLTTPKPTQTPSARLSSIPSSISRTISSSLTTPKPTQTPSARLSSTLSVSSLQRQLLLAQTAKSEMESKLRERDNKIERLERDRRVFLDREKEAGEEWDRDRGELESEKKSLSATLSSLRTQHSTLQEDHTDLLSSYNQLKSLQSSSSSQQRSLIDSLNSRIEMLEEEKREGERQGVEREALVNDLRAQVDAASSSLSSSQRGPKDSSSPSAEDDKILTSELSHLTTHILTLESTNSNLSTQLSFYKSRHESIEVLKEQNRELVGKVGRGEEWRGRVGELEEEVRVLRSELGARGSVSTGGEGGEGATEGMTTDKEATLTHDLSTLRLSLASLTSSHGETLQLLAERTASLQAMEEREVELRVRVEELEGVVEEGEGRIRVLEMEVRERGREGEGLRALVAKLTSDPDSTPTSGGDPTEQGAIIEAQRAQISYLTSQVEELRRENEELKAKVGSLEGELSTSHTTSTTHLTTISTLTTQIDTLEQQLFELSGEIAGGRHIPPGVRVLSLEDNPAERWFDARKEVLEGLRRENEGLMRRVGELEARLAVAGGASATSATSGGAAGGNAGAEGTNGRSEEVDGKENGEKGMVPRESWERINREKEELEEEVKGKEKRLRRLKEIFNSKGAEFRDAIASILGVKLAFFPNGDVRVTSVYDLTTSFVFQAQKKGRVAENSTSQIMQLVAQGEGGPSNLPETMRYWIEEEQCIPGFMASVTLECYDGWKSQKRGEVEDEQGMVGVQ